MITDCEVYILILHSGCMSVIKMQSSVNRHRQLPCDDSYSCSSDYKRLSLKRPGMLVLTMGNVLETVDRVLYEFTLPMYATCPTHCILKYLVKRNYEGACDIFSIILLFPVV